MKHVNEQMPDVQARRPEVSSALAAVVERATAKDPRERYSDMAPMLDDLEGALEVEVARAGGARPARRRTCSTRSPSATAHAHAAPASRSPGSCCVLAGAAVALAIAALTGDDAGRRGRSARSRRAGREVELVGADDFDPRATTSEHPDEVGAGDRRRPDGTAWTTETYRPAVVEDAPARPGSA